ncbi:WSC domain-containing protein (Fragment), variant 2 [Balamuthia mandrillaris]
MGNCHGGTTRRRRSCWPTHDLGGGIGMLLRRRSSCWRRLLLVGIAVALLALLDGSSGAQARRSRFCDYHPNHPACLIEKEQEDVAATDEEQEPQPCLNDFLKGSEAASTQLRPPRSFLLLAVAIAVCLSTASMYIWWLKATNADNNITADENNNQNLATTATTETATSLTSTLLSEAPTSAITSTTTTTTTTTTTVKGSPDFEEVNITQDKEEQTLTHPVSDSDDADECNNDKKVGAEDVMAKGRKDTSSDEEAESPSSSASFLRSPPGASKFAEDECMLTQELRVVKRRSESVSEGEASTTAGQDIEEETYEEKTVVVYASTKSPPSSTNTQEQRRAKQENMDERSHEQRIEGEDNDSHSRFLVPEETGDGHLHHNTDEIIKDVMKISTVLGLSKEEVLSLSPTEKIKYSLECYKLKQHQSFLMEQRRNNKAQEDLLTVLHKSSQSHLEESQRHHAVDESIQLRSSQELIRHNRKKEKWSRQQSQEIRRHHRVKESQLRSEGRQQRLQLFEAHQRTLLLRTTWLALFSFACTWAYFMHFEVGLADVIAQLFDHWDVQRNHFLRLVGASSYGSTRYNVFFLLLLLPSLFLFIFL